MRTEGAVNSGAPPRVFISYSHDSVQHENRVLALSNRLREDGIDASIDQYESFPPAGWPHWMEGQIRDADFVLVVCTETYRRRIEHKEERDKGLGALWEGNIIYNHLYLAQGENKKFVPVFFDGASPSDIPSPLANYTYYDLDRDYESLYRYITEQPQISKPVLGALKRLQPRERNPASLHAASMTRTTGALRQQPMRLSAAEAKAMVVTRGYYCASWNESGKGIQHQYEIAVADGIPVVIDHAAGLMWQKGGSHADGGRNYPGERAEEYARDLNGRHFAGFDDWRVPTLEEGMSLMTPPQPGMTIRTSRGEQRTVHVDPVFEKRVYFIWTSDKASPGYGWLVYYVDACCGEERLGYNAEVKVVRSL